ncbi:MAG: SRPBCC family protein [Myxococcota bacterium]
MANGLRTNLGGVATRVAPFCWILLGANGAGADPSVLTDDDWKRLSAGEAVVHTAELNDRPRVGALVLVPQSVDRIWDIMVDCERAPEFVPNLRRCEVIDRAEDGSWELIEHEVKYRWFAPKTIYRFKAEYVHGQQVRFSRVSGDLRELEGVWGLFPLPTEDDRVLVSYTVSIDPGVFVPDVLVRRALERDLPELMHALRHRVDQVHQASVNH